MPEVPTDVRDHLRTLSGNEAKILAAALCLQGDRQPVSAEQIATETNLNRSTVYRLLPGLAKRGLLVIMLTEKGRQIAELVIYSINHFLHNDNNHTPPSPPPSPSEEPCPEVYITGIPGHPPTKTTHPPLAKRDSVAKCDGLTSHFATKLAFCDSPHAQTPPQTTSETVITQPGDSNSSEPTDNLPDNLRRFALDLAKQSHKALQEQNSLGYHILVWSAALKHDRENQNRDIEDTLVSLCRKLRDRHAQTGRHQGAAWTAATRQILNAHGISLSRRPK
jgi:biotin operon repressor